MTPFAFGLRKPWKTLETFHKTLSSGEKIRVFYRSRKRETLAQSGTWLSTTELNIEAVSLGIERGDVAFVKTGPGSGQLLRIDQVSESSSVTTVTFLDANTFATLNDKTAVDFLNFKFMGEINDTTQDYHNFTIPLTEKNRKLQFLFEFQQVAGNTMEMDYAIINPE
jgi:hypothetical protein